MIALDVGCGRARVPGAIGIDAAAGADAAVRGDALHLPVRDHCVDVVHLANVLEHFRQPERVLAEAHRVLKPGGRLYVRLPHYTSPAAYGCPDHRWVASLQVLRHWAAVPAPSGWRRLYGWRDHVDASIGPRPWRMVTRRLTLHALWRRLGVEWMANVYPELWEAFAAGWIGARDIVAELEPIPGAGYAP